MENKDKIIPKPTRSEVMEYWEKCPAINAGKNRCMFPDKYCRECVGSIEQKTSIEDQLRDRIIELERKVNDLDCERRHHLCSINILEGKIVKMQGNQISLKNRSGSE